VIDAGYAGLVRPGADHREAERVLREAGWTPCGAGDWAIALRAPDGQVAARIPASERRYMTEIPLTSTGRWPAEVRAAMQAALAAADTR
jgi:hypothetical protein